MKVLLLACVMVFVTGCVTNGVGIETEGVTLAVKAEVGEISVEEVSTTVVVEIAIRPRPIGCMIPFVQKVLTCDGPEVGVSTPGS